MKGFDTSIDEDAVREGLQTAFAEYGEVAEVRLPFDRDNQCLKGFGYVVFAEASGGPVRPFYVPAGIRDVSSAICSLCTAFHGASA